MYGLRILEEAEGGLRDYVERSREETGGFGFLTITYFFLWRCMDNNFLRFEGRDYVQEGGGIMLRRERRNENAHVSRRDGWIRLLDNNCDS